MIALAWGTGAAHRALCLLAFVCLVASIRPSIGGPNLNLNPPLAYRDVVICSYVSKTVICHRIAHAYRPLPRPLAMRLHGADKTRPWPCNSASFATAPLLGQESRCDRRGRYHVARLLDELGPAYRLIDWLHEGTADCPQKSQGGPTPACGAVMLNLRDLP
jgi:hypothetical protein